MCDLIVQRNLFIIVLFLLNKSNSVWSKHQCVQNKELCFEFSEVLLFIKRPSDLLVNNRVMVSKLNKISRIFIWPLSNPFILYFDTEYFCYKSQIWSLKSQFWLVDRSAIDGHNLDIAFSFKSCLYNSSRTKQ